jgi:hypothetical protein
LVAGLVAALMAVSLTLPALASRALAGSVTSDVIWPNGAVVSDEIIWPNGALTSEVIWPNGALPDGAPGQG